MPTTILKKSNKNKILLIVESPAKCSTIVSHLGADKYVCVATFGHLQELTGLQDIDTTFANVPQFHIAESKKQQIEKIKALVAECKETYLMTDNDREGAGIAYHVCRLFDLPVATTKRVVFNEITKPALERAIQSPQLLDMDAVHAQIARQALDMLVGFKISPALWNHVQGSALSAGRCQTPALRLIYDNQCAIDAAAEGTIIYNTVGYFTKLNLKYELSNGHDTAEACSAFLQASAAFDHVIRAPEVRPFSKPAPQPLTTSSLQQQASNELNISPAETMLACQHLYEGGYITYPRTDSRVYSVPFLEHARNYITEKWGEKYNRREDIDVIDADVADAKPKKKKRIVVKKRKTAKPVEVDDGVEDAMDDGVEDAMDNGVEDVKPQEAHEAVHVTSLNCTEVPDSMTAKEHRLYRMIWRHSAETCMAPCAGNVMTSCILAPENRDYRYAIERVEFAGWRIVASQSKPDDATNGWLLLKSIVPNSVIRPNKLQSRMQLRELKSHFSEASLVGMLEERGIGRPSTFSGLVHKIQERGYVAKQDVPGRRVNCIHFELDGGVLSQTAEEREFGNEKNRLVIQPLGRTVVEFVCAHFAELFDYDYTKRMEQQLDLVSCGQKRWGDVCRECLSCVDRLNDGLNAKGLTKITSEKTKKHGTKDETNDSNDLNEPSSERNSAKKLCKLLGKYKGIDLFLRTGKYGPYLTWGDNKKSIGHLKSKSQTDAVNVDVDAVECSYDDAVRCIESSSTEAATTTATTNPAILREINAYTSVRTGQYGPYIYYKNPKMTTPAFVSLRGFKEDWKTCDLRILEMWSTTTPVKKK